MREGIARQSAKPFRSAMASVCLLAGALVLVPGVVVAGVVGSKHDLSGQTTATTEVCAFCHTPHGSDDNASVPQWNKSLPTDVSGYSRYSTIQTSSLDGVEAPVGSVSLACLSCHDGSQAMDVVINAPGSDGITAGTELDAGAIDTMSGYANLSSDLRNDHPISIQYGGGGCSDSDTGCTNLGDAEFQQPSGGMINGVYQWWVDTTGGTTGSREKTDMILYTRAELAGVVEPFVECASCHDPHNDTAQPVSFLRVSNTNSGVCMSCHTK